MAQTFPELSGRVVDQADLLSAEDEAEITAQLAQFEEQTQRQLVVTTIADLEGYDIADYGYRLGREWGIGDAERNDGVLLIVAPNDRQTRIEVGYGLEGILTDAYASHIIRTKLVPRFREDRFPRGIKAGTDAIIKHLSLSDAEAGEVVQSQAAKGARNLWLVPLLLTLPGLFIWISVMIALRSTSRSSRAYSSGSGGSVRVSSSSSWSSSSSSSSFSGGGGSFGGGGASGSW